MPELSVVIPAYNRRAFLREAVKSVLVPGVEVIVVDDGSTDGGADTVDDLPVRLIRFGENRGIAAARNTGVQVARAEVVVFLDSDDRAVSSTLLPRARWLQDHPEEWGVVGMPAGKLDEQGNVVARGAGVTPPPRLGLEWLRSGQRFSSAPGLWCVRRSILRSHPFDPEVRIVCDTELLLRLLSKQSLPVWSEPVLWVRHHGENISGEVGRVPRHVLAESHLLQLQYAIP